MKTHDRRIHDTSSPHGRLRPATLCIAVLVAIAAGNVKAGRLNYQIELGGLYSDNIDLSEDDQVEESALIPHFEFDYLHEGSAVGVQARGAVERRFYINNRYPDETRGEFAGQLNWTILPQRLSFVVEDYLSEEPINFRDGRYPGNLQSVNVFIAGPSFYARLGDATRLQLDVRGAESHAEVSDGFDGNRFSAAAVLERDFSPITQGSLHLVSTRAEFDEGEPFAEDYKRHDGFVRFERRLREIEYELDLGHSRLDLDVTDDESLTLARAMVQWQPTSRSRFRLRARNQFADEVQDLVVRLRDPDESLIPDLVDATDSLVTAGVYKQRMADFEYRFSGERTVLRFRPMARKFEYIDRPDADRSENGFFFQADYRLRPLLNVVLSSSIRRREFDLDGQVDIDHFYSIGFDHQLGRNWGWSAEVLRNDRNSNVPDARYRENAVLASVWWRR